MRHILLISYDFPSYKRESAYRVAGWVKYLSSFGWDVSILTVKNGNDQYPNVCQVKTGNFLCTPETAEKTDQEPSPLPEVLPLPSPNRRGGIIKKLLSGCLIPDKEVLWIPNALRKIKEVTGKQKVDLIYTITPPYSMSWLGYQAHCQTGIPWIADIRENWVGTKKHGIFSQFYKNIEKKMEESIIKNAKKIISPSEEWCQFFYERYPFWGKDRFVCIHDGYDREEMENDDTTDRLDSKLSLLYIGEINKDTTHKYLLRAIKELLKDSPSLGEMLRVEFVGSMDEEYQHLISEFSLENVCSYIEDPSGKEGIKRLRTADSGIIIADKERNIPQAIYEYIGTMKPILGLSDTGAVENLIKKENLGWIAPFSSISRIKAALQMIIDRYKKDVLKPNYPLELSIKYEKKAITQRLTDVFDKVLNEKPADDYSIRQKFGYRGNL